MVNGAPPRRNVAIFFDLENLFGGNHRDVTGVQLGAVVRSIERRVHESGCGQKTALIRAYANWARPEMLAYKRQVQEYGIEPVQIFSFEKGIKNAADIELCVDALAVAHDAPWVDVFVVVTGDGGFVPLIRRLHFLNKYVVVVSTTAPHSGVVNPLLKSVADEYHLIQLQEPPHAPGHQVAVKVPAAKVPAAKVKVPAPAVKAKASAAPAADGSPDLHVLRKAIVELVKKEPQLSTKGKVETAALGQRLRSRWPALKYGSYQAKNLGGFVEKYCGLVVHRPGPAKAPAKVPAKAPAKVPVSLPPKAVTSAAKAARNGLAPRDIVTVASRDEYINGVRSFFTEGELGALVIKGASAGLALGDVSTHLRAAIGGFTSVDAGFPQFHLALRQALVGTDFLVARIDNTTMAVVHTRHGGHSGALAPMTGEDLKVLS